MCSGFCWLLISHIVFCWLLIWLILLISSITWLHWGYSRCFRHHIRHRDFEICEFLQPHEALLVLHLVLRNNHHIFLPKHLTTQVALCIRPLLEHCCSGDVQAAKEIFFFSGVHLYQFLCLGPM